MSEKLKFRTFVRSITAMLVCFFSASTVTISAKANIVPTSILIQAAGQPVCRERDPFGFGDYTVPLNGQDLTCWLSKIKIRKIAENPLAPGVEYVSRPGPIIQRDMLGIDESEWLSLTDQQMLAIFLKPANLNKMIAEYNKGYIPSLVPFYLLGEFVSSGEARLAPAFGISYPACAGFDPVKGGSTECVTAYREIRDRITSAGFGQKIVHGKLTYYWSDLAYAIGESNYAESFPRVKWLMFQDRNIYSNEDGHELIKLAKAGFAPARLKLAHDANTCSGTRYVYGPMYSSGLDLKTVSDWAIALGDGEAALRFGQFLMEGTCGALADRKASFDYMFKAAELGYTPALVKLAYLYNNDENFGRDPRSLIALYKGKPDADSDALAMLEQAAIRFDKVAARDGLVTDNAAIAPNLATIRAVMLRELRYNYENFDGGFQNELSQIFGNRYNWDESKGRLEMFQNGNSGMTAHSTQQFNVSSVTCTTISGRQNAYNCRSTVSIFMDAGLGDFKIADNITTRPSTTTDEFVFEGGQWRSPAIRQRMLAGLRNLPSSRTTAQSQPTQSTLCRSLNAGIAAAGGVSTSAALNPNTWGC